LPAAWNQQLPSLEAAELTVFTAASLTDAFTEIGQNFETVHMDLFRH
jgi:ABC-type molybdate transport system substrate-binding protein